MAGCFLGFGKCVGVLIIHLFLQKKSTMALFNSGNPALNENVFNQSTDVQSGEFMTVKGTMNKFGFLLFMVLAGAAYSWHLYEIPKLQTMQTLMWVGLIGGLITGIIIRFNPTLAQWLAPLYAVLEGLLLGAISAIINDSFKESYPGIVIQAVGLTFGVAIAMFLLYNFKVIKPTQRLRSIVFTACAGIFIFYLIDMTLYYAFNINISITDWSNTSWPSIIFSLFVIVIASLRLIFDYETIEVGAAQAAPKYMEWYGSFGLLVTLVWLYIEIIRLLSRLTKR